MTKSKKPSGTHERLSIDEQIKGSSDRGFGTLFALVFTGIGVWDLLSGPWHAAWWLAAGAAIALIAIVRPILLGPLNRLWGKFGLLLHRITTPIILGLIFYAVVTPTALLARLMGKDPLRLRFEPDAKSYWIDRTPPGPSPESMERQF